MTALAALEALAAPPTPPRTLVIDIETTPNVAYTWGMFKQNIGLPQLIEPGRMMSFAAKWAGERKVHFHSAQHEQDRADMIGAAWQLLHESDAVVTYNGDSFDIKRLNAEFVVTGLGPPSPFISVDLIRTVRRRFRLTSNKLDHVLDQLGLERKAETGGFDLWRRCMAGDEKAWRKLRAYNVQDVRATEALFDKLTPWLVEYAPRSLFGYAPHEAGQMVCDRCGGHLTRHPDGRYVTRVSKFDLYHCGDCTAWSRGKRAQATAGARGVQ